VTTVWIIWWFDLHGKVGIGTGKIGGALQKIMHGLVANFWPVIRENTELIQQIDITYTTLEGFVKSDVISVHCPLNQKQNTCSKVFNLMKVIFINTARGTVVNTEDLIDAQSWTYQTVGLDVEKEKKSSCLATLLKNGGSFIHYTRSFLMC
jgi:D-lactate dehydrogenase